MALMYRHGPNKPALIGALVVFIFGLSCAFSIRSDVESGIRPESTFYLLILLTLLIAGILMIIAFARYSFTHLWKSTGARHSDKYPHPSEIRKKRKKAGGSRARGRKP